ncbi:MAG: tyrosine-type recombinase/integrase [Candidatus Marinimicrobia bacterium]|jgi:integrase|nr:tyrosine-type recombinase/integrase [Campylobacteraceae bacterium]MBT7830312.1 tyrosine-type recombinase/integrase [Candidatus Neomarinimicrobiota bacterium]
MARIVIPLNDTKIKNTKIKEKNYTLADGSGLQLLIKSNCTKLWEFIYKSPTKLKRRKTSFGNYPTVSLKQARTKRQQYQDLIISGIDPIEHFKDIKVKLKIENQKSRDFIGTIANKYFSIKQNNKNLKDITIKKAKGRLENHFYKYLAQKENTIIHTITFADILKILTKLEDSGKLETLLRVRLLIIEIFKYAYTLEVTNADLFAKLELYTFKVQKKSDIKNYPTLTAPNDIKRLYKSIKVYEHNIITKYLLLFSIHTAQRQGTIITAQWKHIDFKNQIWSIPKELMKMSKEHILPLSDITIKYLKELRSIGLDSKCIFPNSQINTTRNKYPHISNNTATNALRKMGFTKEEQTAHGFRAMFKTVCKENQEDFDISNEFVERILAHKVEGNVEASYNRAINIKEMRIITNWWSEYLEGLV